MKYAILTFGCRTNQADSFDIECDLRAQGGEEGTIDSADVVVVNTCSVTATAEQAARQAIRRVERLNPHARIVATGCYATRSPSEVTSLAVWRVAARESVADSVLPVSTAGRLSSLPGPGTRGRTVYLLRVQTGCDESCRYCIVPSTRGPSRSVPIARVLEAAADAARSGFKELTLTGVHLGSYGRDLSPSRTLAQLVRTLADEEGSRETQQLRFRLSAVEPMDMDEELVETLASSGRFARHFHLPLQHASDAVLSAMGRPYTLDDYDTRVRALRRAFDDAAIGTDLIVGFPGESEADFEACVEYLLASPLNYVHVFPFSPRPGTPAASLPGRPPASEVRRRVTRLRTIGAQMRVAFRRRFLGALVDGLTIEDGSLVLTSNYLRVRVPAGRMRNERVKVRIVEDGEPMVGFLQSGC